jgi:hypothetical protein
MVLRTARILSAAVVLILIVGVRPASCDGWSILHPFSSDTTTETKPKKPVTKPAPKTPTTWDKVVAAPGNAITKVGNTITGKKPDPPKASQFVAVPKGPTIQPQKKKETKSWLPSLFRPKEPEKPKDVSEWLAKERLDP